MQTILDAARLLGYIAYHTYDSRHSSPGFPDIVLAHPFKLRLVFIECKKEKGRTTRDQDIWVTALEKIAQRLVYYPPQTHRPMDVWIARPSNLDALLEHLKEG